MNYRVLLDEDVLNFVLKTEGHYPIGTKVLSPAKQRKIYSQMCKALLEEIWHVQ